RPHVALPYHWPAVLALARKFSLDRYFQCFVWFQQMLKCSEQEKDAEIRGGSATSGPETSGASPEGERLAGEHRLENRRTRRGFGGPIPAGRPGAHVGR